MGTFDIPHLGHAAFLKQCEQFSDEVVVGVNSDAFVRHYRGVPPVFGELERLALIGRLGYRTMINDGPGRELIEHVKPRIVAVGTDWAKRDYFAQINTPVEYFEEYAIALLYLPYTPGISSTELKARLR